MSKFTLSPLIQPEQKFIYQLVIPVQITDINYGQHLAAIAVPAMQHQVRFKFLAHHGISEANLGGAGLVLADMYVRYHAEAFFDDALLFEFGVESIEKCSATLVYQVTNQTRQNLTAIAKERIVFFDYATRKIALTPPKFIEIVQKYS